MAQEKARRWGPGAPKREELEHTVRAETLWTRKAPMAAIGQARSAPTLRRGVAR